MENRWSLRFSRVTTGMGAGMVSIFSRLLLKVQIVHDHLFALLGSVVGLPEHVQEVTQKQCPLARAPRPPSLAPDVVYSPSISPPPPTTVHAHVHPLSTHHHLSTHISKQSFRYCKEW